ncbi:MAG: glycosyltransferase [Vicinamibacteria bacterium]|nr:glycosyltransferase [Vicinamibacteria bacterium]
MASVPRVSVVMSARDAAPWIAAAIESVLAQELRDIELIVVDDASRDQTRAIALSFDDPRVHVLAEPSSRGMAAGRNRAVQESRAPYVAFMDADDAWLPGKLVRQVEMLDADERVDLCFTGARLTNAAGCPLRLTVRPPDRALSFRDLLARNLAAGSTIMVRRSALDQVGGFDESLTGCIDYDLLLRIALLRLANVRCTPEPLVLWRRRPGQITGDWRRMEAGHEAVMDKILRAAPAARGLLGRSRSSHRRFLAFVALESGEAGEATRQLARSIACWPASMIREPFLAVVAAQLALAAGRQTWRGIRAAIARTKRGGPHAPPASAQEGRRSGRER